MKILMVNKFLYPNGGSETYIFKLGEQLIKMGHEVQYFGMEHPERIVGNAAGCYTTNMDFHTGKLQKLIYPFKILYSWEAKRKLLAVLQDFKPDIVHLNNINFQLTPSLFDGVKKYTRRQKRRLPVIFTAHDSQWVCPNHLLKIPSSGQVCFACKGGKFINCSRNKCIHDSTVKSILGSMEGYLYKWRKTYQMTDTIICPSEFMNKILSTDSILAPKTVTLHNFVTVKEESVSDEGAPPSILPAIIREKGYLLYFGRYSMEKGVRTLLEACRRLPDIPFVFAGKGELLMEVQAVKNVHHVGFRAGKELRDLIRQARFIIFPSECYENCPFSVMEAQMYGTPVLAAQIGGTTELIDSGKTGEFFTPGNVEELCEKINEFWNNSKKMEAYRRNCKNISFDTVEQYCQKLMQIYHNYL